MQGVNFSCSKRCIRDFAIITSKGGWDTRCMGAKGKITTLPREKLPVQQVLLGELRQVLNFLVANKSPPHLLPPSLQGQFEMETSIYRCVAWRMLCHKVNLPSCVAWQPVC